MKKYLKKGWLLSLFFVVMLLLSGCGEGGLLGSGDSWISTEDYMKDTVARTWTFSNMNAMPEALDHSRIYTYEDVRDALEKNESITDEYAGYFSRYIDLMEQAYPDMNLFCFYKNMETLRFAPETEADMTLICGPKTVGNYKASKNTLYFNYEWDQDVEYLLWHEISHMVTNYWREWKGYNVYFDFDKHHGSVAVEEGLNSIFLENIIGYTVEGMSYQIPANHLRVLLEYTDHSLEEILEHDTWYFEGILAEVFEGIGSGTYNASLVNQMIDSGHYSEADRYDLDKDYADYYTGLLYFKNNLKADMTKEEILRVYEDLAARLTEGIRSHPGVVDIHDFTELQNALYEMAEELGIQADQLPERSEMTCTYEYPQLAIPD